MYLLGYKYRLIRDTWSILHKALRASWDFISWLTGIDTLKWYIISLIPDCLSFPHDYPRSHFCFFVFSYPTKRKSENSVGGRIIFDICVHVVCVTVQNNLTSIPVLHVHCVVKIIVFNKMTDHMLYYFLNTYMYIKRNRQWPVAT
jgi:hypothetical protein